MGSVKGSFALILLAALLSSCSSVMLVRTPKTRIFTDPVYESSKSYFFLGQLGPKSDVYVDQICLGKNVDQVETLYTLEDAIAGIITVGIYTPRTVRLWCQL